MKFSDGYPGVTDPIHSMLVADGKLFVVTEGGGLSCFGVGPAESAKHGAEKVRRAEASEPGVGNAHEFCFPLVPIFLPHIG